MLVMKITIIGTGYVGLVTGVCLAYLDNKITFIDIDSNKIEKLKQNILPIYEPGLMEVFQNSKDNLSFTTSYSEAIPQAEIIFITVGTPPLPDGSSDTSYLNEAVKNIAENLTGEDIIIVNKSTVPIGSGVMIENIINNVLKTRKDLVKKPNIYIVSNPEFLKEGTAVVDTFYPSRIVIGSDHQVAINKMLDLYEPIIYNTFRHSISYLRQQKLEPVPIVSCNLVTAELIKYASNAFLSLKISFINEIASLCEKVDADIIQTANAVGLDSRIGTQFLKAGIGWGGSCFGKDASALIACAKDYKLDLSIVDAAIKVNYNQREKVIEKLQEELLILKGKTICILGITFKPDTDDLRDSPSIDIAKKLVSRGAMVRVHDPIALENVSQEFSSLSISCVEDLSELFVDADAIVLATEWSHYRDIPWKEYSEVMRRKIIFDGRNFLDKCYLESIGFIYMGVGR